jgi:hypothetical protein
MSSRYSGCLDVRPSSSAHPSRGARVVRKFIQCTGLVLLTAGLVLGTAGVAGAKTVSDKKYAKGICGAISGVSDTIDQIQPATGGDPSTTQIQILQSTDALLASLNEAKAKAAKLSPSDGGKKVTKFFDEYFQSSVDGVTAARQKLAAADANNVAFAADIAQFSAALQTLEATTGDPFSKLSSNQDFLHALNGSGLPTHHRFFVSMSQLVSLLSRNRERAVMRALTRPAPHVRVACTRPAASCNAREVADVVRRERTPGRSFRL